MTPENNRAGQALDLEAMREKAVLVAGGRHYDDCDSKTEHSHACAAAHDALGNFDLMAARIRELEAPQESPTPPEAVRLVEAFEQAKENCFPSLEHDDIKALDAARCALFAALEAHPPAEPAIGVREPDVDLIAIMQAAAIEAKFANRISFFYLDTFAKAIRKALQSPTVPPNPASPHWLRPEPIGGISLRKAGKYTEVWVFFGNVEHLVIRELSDNNFSHEITAEGIRGVIDGKRPAEIPAPPTPSPKENQA